MTTETPPGFRAALIAVLRDVRYGTVLVAEEEIADMVIDRLPLSDLARQMQTWLDGDGIPPGRYRVHAEISVDNQRRIVEKGIEHGMKVAGLLNLGPLLLEPIPAAPVSTEDADLRERIAVEIATIDGRRIDDEPVCDATYRQMADAALSVVHPRLAEPERSAMHHQRAVLRSSDRAVRAERERDEARAEVVVLRAEVERVSLEKAGIEGERDAADDTLSWIRKTLGVSEADGWGWTVRDRIDQLVGAEQQNGDDGRSTGVPLAREAAVTVADLCAVCQRTRDHQAHAPDRPGAHHDFVRYDSVAGVAVALEPVLGRRARGVTGIDALVGLVAEAAAPYLPTDLVIELSEDDGTAWLACPKCTNCTVTAVTEVRNRMPVAELLAAVVAHRCPVQGGTQ